MHVGKLIQTVVAPTTKAYPYLPLLAHSKLVGPCCFNQYLILCEGDDEVATSEPGPALRGVQQKQAYLHHHWIYEGTTGFSNELNSCLRQSSYIEICVQVAYRLGSSYHATCKYIDEKHKYINVTRSGRIRTLFGSVSNPHWSQYGSRSSIFG